MAERFYRIYIAPNEVDKLPAGVAVIQSYPAFVVASATDVIAKEVQKDYPIDPIPAPLRAPGAGPAAAALTRLAAALVPGPKPRYYRVTFPEPLSPKLLAGVKKAGAAVVEMVGAFGFVADVPSQAVLKKLQAGLPSGTDLSPQRPVLNLAPEFIAALAAPRTRRRRAGGAAAALPAGKMSNFTQTPGSVIASFYTKADRDRAARALKKAGVKETTAVGDDRLVANLGVAAKPAEALGQIAAARGLRRLDQKHIQRTFNSVARNILGAGVIDVTPVGLTGKGETVAVCDTGLDTGDPAHIHPDFAGRVVFLKSYPITPDYASYVRNPGADDGADDRYVGHGTHVAGSVLGDGSRSMQLGLPAIRGIAPQAKLVFQAVEQTPDWTPEYRQQQAEEDRVLPATGLFGLPDDLKALFDEAYEQGARIHTNSWGSSEPTEQGQYVPDCREVDLYMWERKDALVIFAAGNYGVGDASGGFVIPGSVSPPGTAKNCLTVGASENEHSPDFGVKYGDRSDRFPNDPLGGDSMTNAMDDLAAFSGRGPTRHGQRKPDVVAPGTFVLSTRSRQPGEDHWNRDPFPPAIDDYAYLSGTSMAAPLVAGCAALVRQYLRGTIGIGNPTGALMKAALIHSAQYHAARFAHPTSAVPADNEQGWGRVTLASVLAPGGAVRVLFIDDKGVRHGDQKDFAVKISASSAPLRVTLVYTDAPGLHPDHPQEPLINNLNLFVIAPDGTMRLGNDFTRTNSPDGKNNVEGVIIDAPARGTWTVRVVGSSVTEPTDATVPKQDFALVISGAGATLV